MLQLLNLWAKTKTKFIQLNWDVNEWIQQKYKISPIGLMNYFFLSQFCCCLFLEISIHCNLICVEWIWNNNKTIFSVNCMINMLPKTIPKTLFMSNIYYCFFYVLIVFFFSFGLLTFQFACKMLNFHEMGKRCLSYEEIYYSNRNDWSVVEHINDFDEIVLLKTVEKIFFFLLYFGFRWKLKRFQILNDKCCA